MQMLKKLFNSDSKYYLELDELKESEAVQTAVKTAEKTAQVVKEKAAEVAQSEPVKEAAKTVSEVVDTAQDKVTSAISTATPETAKSDRPSQKQAVKAKSAKNGKAKSANAKKSEDAEGKEEAQPAKAAVQNSGASSFDPPFWVAAMNNTNKPAADSNGIVAGETFAEDNLMPLATTYRRRPGGSLDKFKDMAKSAKTPRK